MATALRAGRILDKATGSRININAAKGGASSSEISLLTADGQSNPEGQGGTGLVDYPDDPRLLTPLRGMAADVWLGLITSGGASLPLDGGTITGIGPLIPQIGDANHATTPIEAAARRFAARTGRRTLAWSNAEGGQSIDNMLDAADPEAYHYARNITAARTRAQALCPAGRISSGAGR